MNELTSLILAEIERRSAISMARFMELALYTPELGFYETHLQRIGKAGDFHTSAAVGPVFGELLASQFSRWASNLAGDHWQLVEAGAHDGRLASDILTWFKQNSPSQYAALEYWIIEPSPARQAWQQQALTEFADHVRWVSQWSDLPAVRGAIFSNELFDALPVHVLLWNSSTKTWRERGVAARHGKLEWTLLPEPLCKIFPQVDPGLAQVLPDGFRTEISPLASNLYHAATQKLMEGRIVTIDYGLTNEEFLSPARQQGTLRAYWQHRLVSDVLDRPGEQDITAHVRFQNLEQAGHAAGLTATSFSSQRHFLVKILEQIQNDESGAAIWNPAQLRQFQTLIHPQHFGETFKVLVQERSG